MADGKKPRGLTPERWAEVRKAYESGESEAALSKRFSVDRKTIRARKIKECWIPHASPQVGESEAKAIRTLATSNVIDIATGRAIDKMEQNGEIDGLALLLSEGLSKHASISSGLMQAADELLKDFLKDKDTDLASTREGEGRNVIIREGRAEVFARLVTGIKSAVGVTRDIAGLTNGVASLGANLDNEKRVDEAVLVVRAPKSA